MLNSSSPRRTVLLLLSLAATSCTSTPAYHAPTLLLPPAWQATLAHSGSTENLAQWWSRATDGVLGKLIASAERDSPTLDNAVANIRAARAVLDTDNATRRPQLAASAALSRSGEHHGTTAPASLRSYAAEASWELDLFGRAQRGADAATARIAAREGDWDDARITLAAEVATGYVDYRACELKGGVYRGSAASYRETLRLTSINAVAGLASGASLAQAQANAAAVDVALVMNRGACELTLKSLVALTGMAESTLRALLENSAAELPPLAQFGIASVPAQLLRQRPDLAAAEREVAATSAEIGQAETLRYPTLALSGTLSLAAALGAGATAATMPWSLGPALTLPVFDGGAANAAVRSAEARYAAAVAQWRGKVRVAIKEVEQALASMERARLQEVQYQISVHGYQTFEDAAAVNHRAGLGDTLTLELARRDTLAAKVNFIGVQHDRIAATIALYRALGGGWQMRAAIPTQYNHHSPESIQ